MIRLSAFADEISADPVEQIDCLEANGVKFIEFRSIRGTNVLDLDESDHADFQALLNSRGFGLSAIGSPIGKISVVDPFKPHLARFQIALDLAERYGTPNIRVFSFYLPEGSDPATHRDEVMSRMSELAERALRRGVTLVLENEKGIYGDTAERVADIIDTVHSPALGVAFDPANYVEVGQPIMPAWERLKGRVVHFHVKDYDKNTHKNVPAGQGDGQIPELIADAVGHGYAGFCVLEPHLVVAEKSYGFTGPERFGEAATALKSALQARQIAFA
ncbi:MAG TPA: sugar phosphate isomerase/epimerase [Isosphaeraceae bacterium]|nr:sugar phosphate isomerase/epimerase [Isosphaeraceae bacterium]